MKLTDHEIRDVVKYLEEGKPLPDKYRFMLFDDKREVELVWNGKTNETTNTVLPFQTIEVIDEPRSEEQASLQQGLFDFSGRQISGWTNKLIWGDNKLILSSLKNGPLRQEIENQGGIKLIYIDPPFDVGADFSMNIEIGDESLVKQPSVLEELAYRDTWGRGADSFMAMIYERLKLMHALLAKDGSIYVHCDWRVSSHLRFVLDEIFGKNNFINEISWRRANNKNPSNKIAVIHDTILYYRKSSDNFIFNTLFHDYKEGYADARYPYKDEDGRQYTLQAMYGKGQGQPAKFGDKLIYPPKGSHWRWNQERIDQAMKDGIIVFPRDGKGKPRFKDYLDTKVGIPLQTIWSDIPDVNSQAAERVDYPTQKPESLYERIINMSSNREDLIADFFMGSGTLPAMAEKLGRKWIGSDLGKFSIHTTRKRMIGVQRHLKKEGKNYRAFEILNLGRYERQHYVGVNTNLRAEEQERQLVKKEKDFVVLITKAYKAEPIQGFRTFQAQRASRLVSIGPINLPVSRLYVDKVVEEAIEKGITKVDILAFEFEMGLSPSAQDEAKNKGVDIALRYIPREVFDKRAIEKDQVVFHDVSYIEVKPHIKGKTLSIELTDFSVFYSQDSIDNISAELKPGGTKVEVVGGQIWKVSKDKDTDIVEKEQLTKHWTDWIDYWSVDFDYENRKEMVRVKKEDSDDYEEQWTGDYVFENEWQSFRTKKERKLELQSVFKEYMAKGSYKVAIKVIDIFGNDTTKVIEVNI